jgi:hypothetical protein
VGYNGFVRGVKGHSNVVVSIDFIGFLRVFKMGSFRNFDVFRDERFFHKADEADESEIMGS